jgi:hypothetical protein
MSGILTQTGALFLDAYREINSRKLFWISLILSALVVGAFAGVGINERGFTIFWWDFPGIYNTSFIDRPTFYKILFSGLGVAWWLNVIGIVLALISTAGIIPEFAAGGSVDLYLSKPISRLRLWLTKYATGLTFVALQVLVFTVGCFLLIGIRGQSWDLRVFYAVPVVLLVFSYLFCVCALLGLVTGSTVGALLLTVLFWVLISGVSGAEYWLLMGRTKGRIESEAYRNQFAYLDRQIQALKQRVAEGTGSAQAGLDEVIKQKAELEAKRNRTDPTRRNVETAHSILYGVKSVLPKTGDTSGLLIRWLRLDTEKIDEEEMSRSGRRQAARAARNGWLSGFRDRTEVPFDDPEVIRTSAEIDAQRPVRWVIGTSLAFEAVVLALGAWIFCRRDF